MRLSSDDLKNITQRSQPCAQARWFKRHFGLEIQYDHQGPIITQEAFNALIMRKMGLTTNSPAPIRPQVKIPQKRAV